MPHTRAAAVSRGVRAAAAARARLTPLALASGFPLGRRDVDLPRLGADVTPRAALEDAVRPAVMAGPCFVAFSGGRDSSAVLALATYVARREGVPDPVPVTEIYPDAPRSHEAEWQRLVLDHLGLRERVVLTVGPDETVLGDAARASLRRLGVLALPQLHGSRMTTAASGGWLLTGEGGDEVLGARRITPWNLVRLDRRRPSRAHARWLWRTRPRLREAFPSLAGYLPGTDVAPWLRPRARRQMRAELVRWQRAGWRFDTGTVDIAGSALVADYLACFDAVATDAGAVGLHPLVDPSFLVALARTGGRWGFRGRTDAMRYLFADLLPDAVLSRSSKASFNGVGFGERERDFARRWDGAGVDHDLVDVEALRRHWLSESPLFTSAVPMHAAWLAGEGLGLEGQGGPVGE